MVVNTLSILFDRMILMKHIQDGAQPMMKSAFLRMSKFIHKFSNKNEKEGEAMPLVDDMPAEVVDQTIPSFTIDEILEDKASFGKDWEEDREAKRAKLLSECYAHREPVEMASKCCPEFAPRTSKPPAG